MKNEGVNIDLGISTTLKAVKEYVDLIVKPPLKEMGNVMGDQISTLRYKNQVRLIEGVKRFHAKRGIQVPNKIPIKFFKEVMDGVAFEEDKKLQKMWLSLLAKSTITENQENQYQVLASVLKELTPVEAEIIYKYTSKESDGKYRFNHLDLLKHKESKIEIALDNLRRLAILDYLNANQGKGIMAPKLLRFTSLGKLLVDTVFVKE